MLLVISHYHHGKGKNSMLRGFGIVNFSLISHFSTKHACREGSWRLISIRWSLFNTVYAAAKSLQLCPTLCNPIDGSPPGSPVPGILQARTLEWVAISFSSAWKWKVKVKSLSRVRLVATWWTAAYQAPLSMGFSSQEYWSGVPLPSIEMFNEGLEELKNKQMNNTVTEMKKCTRWNKCQNNWGRRMDEWAGRQNGEVTAMEQN